jgi:A/G-specific adenine glycosylase
VIAWQKTHGRRDLPWQNTRDPYRIWVSEIMLQQTQVAAVIGYYARFLERVPDVASLAAADATEVMRLWSGLGYYSRARNLHAAARRVMKAFGGAFPKVREDLESLPGVGRSTAAAIAAFAFGAREAILDGNVKRVFARYFGIKGWPGDAAVTKAMWAIAERELPAEGIEAYIQGQMDLGATLCTRSRPRCEACPLATDCVARNTGCTAQLPQARPRKAVPRKSCVMLVLADGERIHFERRPPAGIWGGLLCLPQADDEEAAAILASALGGRWGARQVLPAIEHGFTHYHLTILPMRVPFQAGHAIRDAAPEGVWLTPGEAAGAGLPAPIARLMRQLAGEAQGVLL